MTDTSVGGSNDSAVSPTPSPYEMTVDLNVIEHLGINLYSNIAAVLTEAVANAWDADAEQVEIEVDPNQKWIAISDDGVGMSVADINDKYLRVGYRRRDDGTDGSVTAKRKRPVMGRKGLGKLSLFSIANVIDVQSAKNGEAHGLRMTVEGIRQSLERGDRSYRPEPLPREEIEVSQGTRIVLKEIKRTRLTPGVTALRMRLARRFSIIGELHRFRVAIDGEPITAADRGDLSIAQFLWTFGDYEPPSSAIPNVVENERLPDRSQDWAENWTVGGWLGTARKPKQLDSREAGNLNGIVVFARGRLFHENILDKVNDGRLYTKYLTGQIEAEFLDQDDGPDIATSDRQRIQEDDPRYEALLSFLRSSLSLVEKRWTEWRRKHEVRRAKEVSPALEEWLATLPEGHKTTAEKLIARLSALPVDEDDDRKLLYRHGILAFERMRLRGSTGEFVDNLENVDKLLRVLADRDALEAALYRDIVKSRLEAVREFQGLVDKNVIEKVLQQYLFDHLWLLDPAWERATGSELIESRLREVGVITDDLTEKEKLSRVDIAYRTNAGKHIIVELKRAGRALKLLDLVAQGQTYVDKLKKILLKQGDGSPDIEVVFVLGKPIQEQADNPERLKASMTAVSPGSRVIYYDTLIRGAEEAYSEYLKASKKLDLLEGIVERI
ncbi:MAG: ATP-binding protein [Gemmatimonadota bacterium]|nr:ATP-binding protein [Gemmatimonadota bacterium]